MVLHQLCRKLAVTAGSIGLVGLVAFSAACGNGTKEAPGTTTTTTATPSPASSTSVTPPVEHKMDPHGGNLFTPGDKAHPAPTEAPGQRRHTGGDGGDGGDGGGE